MSKITTPITVFIANGEEFMPLLEKAKQELERAGLSNKKDYEFFGVPSGFAEVYSPIMVSMHDNPWNMNPSRFYGKEGLESFFKELNKCRAA